MLFRRLSVFSGGWTMEAAEAVCAGDGIESSEIFDLLLHLLDKSLILMDEQSAETRYHMLETIREYARDRLQESSEADNVQQQHFAYFLQFAEKDEPGPETDELHAWRRRLDSELDNLRGALNWSLKNDVVAGLRLTGVVGRFCGGTLRNSEALDLLRKFLARPEVSSLTPEKAKTLLWAGVIQRNESWRGQVDTPSLLRQSRAWLEESLANYQELGDQAGVADSLFELGFLMENQGDWEAAREFYTGSVRTSQEAGDKIRAARGLNILGDLLIMQGDGTQARRYHEEAVRIYHDSGRRYAARLPLGELGNIAMGEGDLISARLYSEESLALYREFNDERNATWVLLNLAEIAARQGCFDEARAYIDGSMTSHQEGGLLLGVDFLSLAFLAFTQSDYSGANEFDKKSLWEVKNSKYYGPFALEGLASVAAIQGKAQRALILFGAAAAIRAANDVPAPPLYKADNERGIATARAQLNEAEFTVAWAEGQAMTMEEAIVYALKESDG